MGKVIFWGLGRRWDSPTASGGVIQAGGVQLRVEMGVCSGESACGSVDMWSVGDAGVVSMRVCLSVRGGGG